MEAVVSNEEKRLRKEEIHRWHLEMDEESNRRFNTTDQMCFHGKEVYFPLEEDMLRRVNEITLDGQGDFSIEVYDFYTTIFSTIPSTMKRVFWNRLNFNFSPNAYVDLINNETKMRIHDVNFSLSSEKRSRKRLPSGLSKDDIAAEKFKFLQEYLGWRYGCDEKEVRLTEWRVHGVEIEFINKKNTGELNIANRSSKQRIFKLRGGRVTIDPFQNFRF